MTALGLGLGLDHDLVADFADAIDFAGDAFCGVFLRGIFCESREDHDGVHRFDADACGVDVRVADETAFDFCGHSAVSDVAAEALLATEDGARGEGECCGDDDGEEEAGGHG